MKNFVIAFLVTILTILIIGTIVMWLWNFIMPDVFGLPHLNWFQSIVLYFLAHLLFNYSGELVNINNNFNK